MEKKRKEWPRYGRYDGKRELKCEHGIGHGGLHGCDGCCHQESFKKRWKEEFGEAKE